MSKEIDDFELHHAIIQQLPVGTVVEWIGMFVPSPLSRFDNQGAYANVKVMIVGHVPESAVIGTYDPARLKVRTIEQPPIFDYEALCTEFTHESVQVAMVL